MRHRRALHAFASARPAVGFTLVELLVVITLVAILIGLAVPAFVTVRNRAAQAREMAAGRTLMAAWAEYAHDSNGSVLPGYRSGLPAFDENGNGIAAQTIGIAAARYPWRLAPYLSFNFRSLYLDEQRQLLEQLEAGDYSNYLYQASAYPSLGLNATWVGGDENQGGFNSAFQNAFGNFYVSRLSTIRNPARLMAFVSARGLDPGTGDTEVRQGYFRVRSPNFTASQWTGPYDPENAASNGQVASRHGGRTIAAFCDGHVETRTVDELRDMRLWSDRANAPDWVLAPGG